MDMTIKMPRGDIRKVRFSIANPDGSQAENIFDEIYFTVKTAFSSREYLFQKRLSTNQIEYLDGSYEFFIESQDTDNLRIGSYVFDIEVVAGADIKQTFVGNLVLTNEVTFAENEV